MHRNHMYISIHLRWKLITENWHNIFIDDFLFFRPRFYIQRNINFWMGNLCSIYNNYNYIFLIYYSYNVVYRYVFIKYKHLFCVFLRQSIIWRKCKQYTYIHARNLYWIHILKCLIWGEIHNKYAYT